MQAIGYEVAKSNKLIRFRDKDFHDVFFLPDGGKIKIIDPLDAVPSIITCTYVGAHHFTGGNFTYHIDQFAEMMACCHKIYEPLTPVLDLSLYEKLYADRSLLDADGRPMTYRKLISYRDP